MLSKNQINEMLEMQEKMNTIIDADWRDKNHDYLLAAMVEAVEAIEHYGYKWWKEEKQDMAQFQMELVDIIHFGLSYFIASGLTPVVMHELVKFAPLHDTVMINGEIHDLNDVGMVDRLKFFVSCLASDQFSLQIFDNILLNSGMTWDQLYKMYIGKNTLNEFRQDNGYKTGEYIKDWDGQEDNEFLTDVLNDLTTEVNIRPIIYGQLEDAYKIVLEANFAQESIS